MNYENLFKENKKLYLKMINNRLHQQVNLSYLKKVIDKEYKTNKNFIQFKENLFNLIDSLSKKNSPILVNTFISRFMLMNKSKRKQFLKTIQNSIFNLQISYIDYYQNNNIAVNFR